ncbi:hypothetical protein CGMCC3_g11409 [Colletotrichum fructicola]|nr:uncharacterized protein CGMCC3_g11409 [Colletotrichum fructicola]KAE9572461.1 hypothetical protein CGMCC3_g11409 [Colletotrichum fructicola]
MSHKPAIQVLLQTLTIPVIAHVIPAICVKSPIFQLIANSDSRVQDLNVGDFANLDGRPVPISPYPHGSDSPPKTEPRLGATSVEPSGPLMGFGLGQRLRLRIAG